MAILASEFTFLQQHVPEVFTDKLAIDNSYVIPDMSRDNVSKNDFIVDDEIATHVIQNYTSEHQDQHI